MKFKAFLPYSKIDLCIMDENDMPIEFWYPTLEELIEEHGDVEYTYTTIDGFEVELDDFNLMNFDNIEEN